MKKILSWLLTIVLAITLVGCSPSSNGSTSPSQKTNSQTNTNETQPVNNQLKVHYINVGQADSILIQQNGQNMLIDAGTNDQANNVVSYLKNQGIKKLDYLILTHPHEDHIGGADAVINNFNIETLYMPKKTSTTKTFKDVITAMNNKGLKATSPVPGNTFKLGDAICTILAPNSANYEDVNDYSIVIKLQYGKSSFLFTGDAQALSEGEILNKGFDVKADVLKVGHHGSHTSTSDAFLSKVNPKFAVISAGKGNDYGHPHKEIIAKLKAKGIKIFRTDENGTIIATSDGTNITFSTK